MFHQFSGCSSQDCQSLHEVVRFDTEIFCIVQTGAVMLVRAFEDKECVHVGVCAQCKGLLGAPCATYTSCLGQRFFKRFFPAVVPHEGYGAGFFVSGVLPASALRLCGACTVLEGTVFLRLTSLYCLGRFLLKALLVLA